jgi:hypothetical protein
MVRAILSGAKTQTRRVVRLNSVTSKLGGDLARAFPDLLWGVTPGLQVPCVDGTTQRLRSPWMWPEPSLLWVRETFAPAFKHPDALTKPVHDGGQNPGQLYYRADVRNGMIDGCDDERITWRPSIFMPRWASRITLEVTGVRVERLHDVSEADATAEGVKPFPKDPEGDCWTDGTHRRAFEYLWGQLNGYTEADTRRAGCSWASNPWVWAVTFRRLDA